MLLRYETCDWEKLHTRQLLKRLDELRRIPWCDCGCWRTEDNKKADSLIFEIKEVLKTRPHISNKKEAKEYRRKKAQGKL